MAVMELQPWFQRILRAAGVADGEAIENEVLVERVEKAFADLLIPIPMVLNCPAYLGNGKVCGARHLDEGMFASKPHHTHSCQECGNTWRPSVRYTVGVQFLPGFKNEPEVKQD